MALSMDEQRILDEIERRLAEEDPGLAARLTAFGNPRLAMTLRSRRGRMLASMIALVTLAVISVAAYAMIPLGMRHAPKPRPAPASIRPAVSARSATSRASATSPSPAHSTVKAVANPSASRSAANPTP